MIKGSRLLAHALLALTCLAPLGAAHADRALPTPAALPVPAGAVSPPKGPRLLANTIPGNGALLLDDPSKTPNLLIEVRDALGNVIAGSVVQIDNYTVWRPALPLSPGVYTVTLPQGGGVTKYDLTVEAARVLKRPALTARFDLQRSEQSSDPMCCTQLSTGSAGMCFPTLLGSYASLGVEFTGNLASTDWGQFLFKFSAAGFNTAMVYEQFRGQYGPFMSQSQQPEYCWGLSAIDIATGTMFSYDDVLPRCKSGMEVGELGFKPLEVGAKELDRAVCHVAPMPYVNAWCQVNQAACSADRALRGCENYGPACLHEPAQIPPTSSTTPAFAGRPGTSLAASGAPGSSDAGTSASVRAIPPPAAASGSGALTGAAGAASAAAATPRHVRACSVSSVHANALRSGGSAGCLMALAGLTLARRLRGRRANSSGARGPARQPR